MNIARMEIADVMVVGGGIVGLATAYALRQRQPGKRLWVLEKESAVGQHQTGHNSGVLHAGIYYKPGSLKAVNCRTGKKAMETFCQEHGIPYRLCGKVVVATHVEELERLQELYNRGQANGVDCALIEPERLRELEPHVSGVRAIHVRETGIVDYRQVCEKLASLLQRSDQSVRTGVRVLRLVESEGEVVAHTTQGELRARFAVNCCGLYSDHLARASGLDPQVKIIPFRGEYFQVKPEGEALCRNLIYPVPDPRFPFLGVHFTRMIGGHVECGPNAVLAFAREGYRKSDLNLSELWEALSYPGFIRLAARYWRTGAGEMWRSVSKGAFVRALQRLVPAIQPDLVVPAPAGVRAQAVARDGTQLDDFAFRETRRIVHVLNAPSPAATASLSIGQSIAGTLERHF
ncbi:MAG TPA: L-2-hydroxyglutarate oxidase [Candidatus Paceibacterota bacterium]|nr:L-2-hydroxyglutarate oxidase [Verrucomicrobiota bacterium]HRY48361.1 L-2-hydroxyglutarate oxidase [Candidatus Paceibacterota bacterium]